MAGFLLDKEHPQTTVEMKGYLLEVSLDQIFETEAKAGYGLVIALGRDEFLGAGSGFRVSVSLKGTRSKRLGLHPSTKGLFPTACGYPVVG